MNKVRFCKLDTRAKPPTRKNSTDAGLDLYALEDCDIPAGSFELVRTGISLEVPSNFVLKLWAKGRSEFLVGAGVVDTDYQPGEIIVRIFNPLHYSIRIRQGDAICQAVYLPIETPQVEEVTYWELQNNSGRSKTGGILSGTSEVKFLGETNQGC